MKSRIELPFLTKHVFLLPFLASLLCRAAVASDASPILRTYATTPGAQSSQTFSLTVNGEAVFVEKFKDVSYARFSFAGPANIRIKASEEIQSSKISPLSYGILSTAKGRDLSFSISEPRKLMVFVNQLEKLIIFADPLETHPPVPGDGNVVNVMKYVHDNTGGTLQTAGIQAAIDATARLNGGAGGVLYFPNGKYLTGSFYPTSNVAIYLESGALIQGSSNPKDYTRREGDKGPVALVHFRDVHNGRIFGRGTIAASGTALRAVDDTHIRICNLSGCSNVGIYDVVLRDSAGFNIHIFKSDNIMMKDYKIVNDVRLSNQDGTDPDSSTNVTVSGVFMYTSDDAIAVKADAAPCENVLVRDCVFWTIKSALKIGSDPLHGARKVTFENNNVVHADRALALYVGSSTFIEDVNFVNDRSEDIGGDAKRQLIIFEISDKKRMGRGSIKNVNIIDYSAQTFSQNDSTITGLDPQHQVWNVTFKHLVIEGRVRTNAESARIKISNGSNIFFQP